MIQYKDRRQKTIILLLASFIVICIFTMLYKIPTRCDVFADGNASAARAVRLLNNDTAVPDAAYAGIAEHPACLFFRSNAKHHVGHSERSWGSSDRLCIDDTARTWLQRSKSNCYSCIYPEKNICSNPPLLLYHMSLDHLHEQLPEANLLSIQAYLMTQDLTKSRLILWALQPTQVYTSKSAWLFDTFSTYITIQQFDYDKEVVGTPWENDLFFGRAATVKQHMTNPACYSDLVRMIILHKYGGVWMDTDVIWYQDVTHLMLTSYQFVMRWTNNHVLRMEAGSPLTHRWLQLAKSMPLNHPDFEKEIIEKLCRPNGYYQIAADTYRYMDIYNGCLLRLLIRQNNTGPAEAMLYDLPLGWFDHDWIGCATSRQSMSDTEWHELANTFLAMHNRYPGDTSTGPDDSPLNRVIKIIRDFFKICQGVHCLPIQGTPLLAFEGLFEKPPEAQRRQLLQLVAGGAALV